MLSHNLPYLLTLDAFVANCSEERRLRDGGHLSSIRHQQLAQHLRLRLVVGVVPEQKCLVVVEDVLFLPRSRLQLLVCVAGSRIRGRKGEDALMWGLLVRFGDAKIRACNFQVRFELLCLRLPPFCLF